MMFFERAPRGSSPGIVVSVRWFTLVFIVSFVSVAGISVSERAEANLLSNGGFESIPGPGNVNGPNTTSITDWAVYHGEVQPHGIGLLEPYHGVYSIDLEGRIGEDAGILEQGFPTIVGQLYLVEFALAGNPAAYQGIKELKVSLATTSAASVLSPYQSELFDFDTTGQGPLPGNVGWTEQSFTFAAQSTTTWLSFVSLQTTGFGPVIDAVSVTEVGCSADGQQFFSGLGTAGQNSELPIASPYVAGDYEFEPYSGQGGTLLAYGELHGAYADEPGLHTSSVSMGITEIGMVMQRTDSQLFDVCGVYLAEGESGVNADVFNFSGGFTVDQQVVYLDGVQGAEWIPLSGFDQIAQLKSLGYTDTQWTDVCTCQGIACCPPALSGVGGYCMSGTSQNVGWSWEIANKSLPRQRVDIAALPLGATPEQFAAAFVASINSWFQSLGSKSKARLDNSNPECFTIKMKGGGRKQFNFSVGPLGGPTDCYVTRNGEGCAFNPTIIDSRFFSTAANVPALGTTGLALSCLLLLGITFVARFGAIGTATRVRRGTDCK